MPGAAQGELIARMGRRSNESGSGRCGNPKRVALSEGHAQVRLDDGAERRLTETLGRRSARRFVAGSMKRERGDRAKSWLRSSPENPGRAEPMGASPVVAA
jgi:hypothetical protein